MPQAFTEHRLAPLRYLVSKLITRNKGNNGDHKDEYAMFHCNICFLVTGVPFSRVFMSFRTSEGVQPLPEYQRNSF